MSRTLTVIAPLLGLTLLWWLLSGGVASSWLIGLPAVLVAAWASRSAGADSGSVSLSGLARFLPYFAWESIRGGIDVALRVLGPRVRVAPAFFDYAIQLRRPQARLLFVNSVSLLPGTLAADLQDHRLRIHALDGTADVGDELHRLERVVGRVYGEVL